MPPGADKILAANLVLGLGGERCSSGTLRQAIDAPGGAINPVLSPTKNPRAPQTVFLVGRSTRKRHIQVTDQISRIFKPD